MESSMPRVVPAQLVSEPTVPKQQSVPKSCVCYHRANQICCLNRQKEGCCTFASTRTPKSST
ncbi:unnamed protein product [Hymenolepis diminuta]|uniref:Uncharacterized protein n=1 Tax=Hymenolepis diminuta TaxID=6216 RepID=A0A564Y336_HYMDI|nr:unnamed protein product [Hymenolepis diminuta]